MESLYEDPKRVEVDLEGHEAAVGILADWRFAILA